MKESVWLEGKVMCDRKNAKQAKGKWSPSATPFYLSWLPPEGPAHIWGFFFSTSVTANRIILPVILLCDKLTLNLPQVLYDDFRTLKMSATLWCIPEWDTGTKSHIQSKQMFLCHTLSHILWSHYRSNSNEGIQFLKPWPTINLPFW